MKGVCITLCEAQRNRQDERRYGPRGEETEFQGAVMSRRAPRQSRVEKVHDKEKDNADAFVVDYAQVFAKKGDSRLKWLQRGLTFAAKKYVPSSTIYDIATNRKFISGVSDGVGKQMNSTLMANLHLFSSKQQRFLQSDLSTFYCFSHADEAEDSGSESAGRRDRIRGENQARNGSRSRSRARSPDNVVRSTPRLDRLVQLLAGNSEPLRHPPILTSRGFASRYPFPLPDIVPGEDVRKYAFGTADDFLAVGDDEAAAAMAAKEAAISAKGIQNRMEAMTPRSPSRTPSPEGMWKSDEVRVKA